METVFWYILYAALFVGLVWGGFWVIARAGLPRAAAWIFGILVLIIIIFALMYLTRGHVDPVVIPN